MGSVLASSPPLLPVPRHPSPLSFSSVSASEDQTSPPKPFPQFDNGNTAPSMPRRLSHSLADPLVPVQTSPDSLLLRSTFSALEHSATTLKRLSKTVLACTSAYLNALEQLQQAENEVLASLGELGRWLEGGYGLHESAIWDDNGFKKLRQQARRKEKEDLEVMVEHGLKAVRSELKRNGLAGGSAQSKFDATAKQFYNQTSAYLAPHQPISSAMVAESSSSSRLSSGPETAQAARVAQFDLVRYSHHSTLLYAVPPTSIPCLDLLVGLYNWVGSQLGETPQWQDGVSNRSSRTSDLSKLGDEFEVIKTPTTVLLKSSLSSSLGQLGEIRTDLLQAWAARNKQITVLEEAALRSDNEGYTMVDMGMAPVSSQGIDQKKKPKMHKLHRSVGGRLRDLMSSSGSRVSLSDTSADRMARMSLDSRISEPNDGPSRVRLPSTPTATAEARSIPPRNNSASPYLPGNTSPTKPFESSPDLRMPTALSRIGGVGGLGAGGDEDEQREEAGRKKEGVLWGTGAWEDLSKAPGRGKYEKLWVVLDRSRIFEYRDSSVNRPESAHAVIDLKFASIREGRDTDRRFVFEIVTPTSGKRIYQSTSEHEMKQWVYAICNAIESCITGTSSVRTFDATKLRSPSGSLDDHALPSRRLFDGRLPTIPGSPGGNRRSMPPPSRNGGMPPTSVPISRQRQTSFKKKIRQSAEIAGEKWSSYLSAPKNSDVSKSPQSPSSPVENGRSTPDNELIAQSVLEMAGLGIGISPATPPSGKRIHSDGAPRSAEKSIDIVRSRSADAVDVPDVPDLRMLRGIADTPANSRCADCGRGMKSSRWATLSLRDTPMVLFLCIRCVGIHRSLGTHISKPRSVDLDIWSPESILLARDWGNDRGNQVWERLKPPSEIPTDENVGDFIRAKYVEGRWLGGDDRSMFGLSNGGVGQAL